MVVWLDGWGYLLTNGLALMLTGERDQHSLSWFLIPQRFFSAPTVTGMTTDTPSGQPPAIQRLMWSRPGRWAHVYCSVSFWIWCSHDTRYSLSSGRAVHVSGLSSDSTFQIRKRIAGCALWKQVLSFNPWGRTYGIPGVKFALASLPFRKLQILRDLCGNSLFHEQIFPPGCSGLTSTYTCGNVC